MWLGAITVDYCEGIFARGYTPVTVTQIHSPVRAFKSVHPSSRIAPEPLRAFL
jgi:hypothetical protein